MALPPFRLSEPLSLGVELEVQLLSPRDFDLAAGSQRLLDYFSERPHAGAVTHEITESMLEVSTGVHAGPASLLAELRQIRDQVACAAGEFDLLVCGGGSHPFEYWPEQRISEVPRAQALSDFYGYLAKQNTLFGQHIHVGCTGGDEAMYLLHALSRYVPHFIALAASSPYSQGADTCFDCCRLNLGPAFPVSGRAPSLLNWADFVAYFEKLEGLGIVESIKDFYWDIRPKAEFGTVEVRVCDTPLTVERAAALAAYVQALAAHLLDVRPTLPNEYDFLAYSFSRFTACRFGLEAPYIDPSTGARGPLRDHILRTLDEVAPYSRDLGSEPMLGYLRRVVDGSGNDAAWIRETYGRTGTFPALMCDQARRWAEGDPLLP